MNLLGPRLWFIPIAVAFVLVEIWVLHRDRNAPRPKYTGYDWRDSIAGPMVGATAQVVGVLNRLLLVQIAAVYTPLVFFEIRNPVADYVVAIVAWDFAFYWFHRLSHRTSLGWSSHITHHESSYFNFSTALRLEWFPIIGLLTFPPIALLGVSKEAMAVAVLVNGFYGGVIHTETVGKLSPAIEWLFNTPWHHRVHHKRAGSGGSNFANSFIVWDRLFGTFEETVPERAPYGVEAATPHGPLRTPLFRFNTLFIVPLWNRVHGYGTGEQSAVLEAGSVSSGDADREQKNQRPPAAGSRILVGASTEHHES